MTHLLSFLSGSLLATAAFWLYAIHIERQNQLLIHAARRAALNEGYALGYQDRAMSGEKTGNLTKV